MATFGRPTTWPSPARSAAIFGLYLYVELVHAESVCVRDAWAGLTIGGAIGFFLNASGPFRDGAWLKLARAADLGVPAARGRRGDRPGAGRARDRHASGGLIGRAVSWAVLGSGIGVSQGLAERSRQRLLFTA